ncbi:MAG: hypothetical protein Q4F01_01985 [Staphylococcus rostri]|uniref:hypothetical protein n=1 Tax=Staphylococcus rostri TaxID=522262 RepID=UPI0026E0CFAE|nr:hypothetical protein [Staphylococcus rostri]MDO5374953.1 hypothetical protein [Staphylococcus rostri]
MNKVDVIYPYSRVNNIIRKVLNTDFYKPIYYRPDSIKYISPNTKFYTISNEQLRFLNNSLYISQKNLNLLVNDIMKEQLRLSTSLNNAMNSLKKVPIQNINKINNQIQKAFQNLNVNNMLNFHLNLNDAERNVSDIAMEIDESEEAIELSLSLLKENINADYYSSLPSFKYAINDMYTLACRIQKRRSFSFVVVTSEFISDFYQDMIYEGLFKSIFHSTPQSIIDKLPILIVKLIICFCVLNVNSAYDDEVRQKR